MALPKRTYVLRFYCLKIRTAYSFDGLALGRRPSILGEQKNRLRLLPESGASVRDGKRGRSCGRSSRRFVTMDASHAVSRRKNVFHAGAESSFDAFRQYGEVRRKIHDRSAARESEQTPACFYAVAGGVFRRGLRQIEKTRMAGLPILNPKLVVRSAGWRRWGNDWIGVVTTPGLCLVFMPAVQEKDG